MDVVEYVQLAERGQAHEYINQLEGRLADALTELACREDTILEVGGQLDHTRMVITAQVGIMRRAADEVALAVQA